MRQDLDHRLVSSSAAHGSGGTTTGGRRRFPCSLGAGAHAVLALVLALSGGAVRAQDAGTPEVVDVERAVVTQPDGGVLHLRGGCWLNDAACIGTARELVELREENAALRQAPPPPVPTGYLAAAALGLLGGVLLGLGLAGASSSTH